jgi:site-specific recombinase XerD
MLDTPPVKRKLPAETYTPEEVAALLRACGYSRTGVRNRALLAVLYRGGLRLSEALALRPKDLDRSAGTVRILHGKGDKARTVGLDDGAFAVVGEWLAVRETLPDVSGRDPVFCTMTGTALKTAYVRALLPRLGEEAGIHKRVHAHGLRHSHASDLLREGMDVGTISRQLGHSSIATTATYLAHINPQAVIDKIRQRPAWMPVE